MHRFLLVPPEGGFVVSLGLGLGLRFGSGFGFGFGFSIRLSCLHLSFMSRALSSPSIAVKLSLPLGSRACTGATTAALPSEALRFVGDCTLLRVRVVGAVLRMQILLPG